MEVEIKEFSKKTSYRKYLIIKDVYASGNRQKGILLLDIYKKTYTEFDCELLILNILQKCNEPEITDYILTDMKSIGYPVEKVMSTM
jgi:hypothetical protein